MNYAKVPSIYLQYIFNKFAEWVFNVSNIKRDIY